MADFWETLTVLCAGFSTLAIFSFLIKENRFYRFFEYLFIGIAAGYLPIMTVKTFLWPQILEPMFGFDIVTFPDGTTEAPYNPMYLLYLLPLLFGLLYYFIFSKRFGWIAKMVISFSLGASAGLGFQGFFAEVLPQIFGSFKPLIVFLPNHRLDFFSMANHFLFILILLSVMYYFFFTFKRSERGQAKIILFGRIWMMVCFGAFFGSTVMARLALLVERIQFLTGEFWPALLKVFVRS